MIYFAKVSEWQEVMFVASDSLHKQNCFENGNKMSHFHIMTLNLTSSCLQDLFRDAMMWK